MILVVFSNIKFLMIDLEIRFFFFSLREGRKKRDNQRAGVSFLHIFGIIIPIQPIDYYKEVKRYLIRFYGMSCFNKSSQGIQWSIFCWNLWLCTHHEFFDITSCIHTSNCSVLFFFFLTSSTVKSYNVPWYLPSA